MYARQHADQLLTRLRRIEGIHHQAQHHDTWCVLATLSMLTQWRGEPISQEGLQTLTPELEHQQGVRVRRIPTLLQHLGFVPTIHIDPKLDDVIRHLEREEPVLAVYHRPFQHHRYHTIIIGGHVDREALLVHDPLQPAPQLWYGEDLIEDEMRMVVSAYGIAKR